MARLPTRALGRYLLDGRISRKGCHFGSETSPAIRGPTSAQQSCGGARGIGSLSQSTRSSPVAPSVVAESPVAPLRKRLKEEAKAGKKASKASNIKTDSQTAEGWELTVGVEIHARLNTPQKLFSPAATSFNDEPNSHVALFDSAVPGSQPTFQHQTLIPALRAALALNCKIQPVSRFDRKHYFWWDQPSGYQITQYFSPFATEGHITLYRRDGIASEDGESVTVQIQQVQMEQDTAKTIVQPGDMQWLDLNRVGIPLIEIITKPQIHHPRTAAALVRKVQNLLNAVDACVSGMETGGLRADVNVSVKRTQDGPMSPLGTRTEIKNLSTIKAIEDAIIAERDRQIAELEAGGSVVGETRGWTLGSKQTRRLRGKEGEVDYRYMPDPDLAPLLIDEDLISRLKQSVTYLPDHELDDLIDIFGLSAKDALAIMSLDNGGRLEYFYRVVEDLGGRLTGASDQQQTPEIRTFAPLVANWILHELGRLALHQPEAEGDVTGLGIGEDGSCDRIPVESLSGLLFHLHRNEITGKVAKELLMALYLGNLADSGSITAAIDAHDLWYHELSEVEYENLARAAIEGEEKTLQEFKTKKVYPRGKLMFLVGKMIRMGPTERISPPNAERVMRAHIAELCEGSLPKDT